MDSILSAHNLSVGYENRAVISGIDIDAMRGQIICLLGPNGAGKSTILRTLAGLLAPVSGTVTIENEPIGRISHKQMAKTLSIVLTDSVTPAMTTVYELVSMGRMPYTDFMGRLTDNDRRIVDEALVTVGAADLKERRLTRLSDGERQKVMIARALVQEPQLIILDEPTGHLDIKHKIEVIRVLQRLANEKNITCILSLHDIDLALKGCRTVLLVNDGAVVAQGTPEDIITDGSIQKLYDICGAKYNELMGAVEFTGSSANDIFVTGGNGSAVSLYRALSRSGYGITSGVLYLNDVDFQVADAVCGRVITEAPFECVSKASADKAYALAADAVCVIDSGFPVGSCNIENVSIITRALNDGKPVLSLRSREDSAKLYPDISRITFCGDIASLLAAADKIMIKEENNK